MSITLRQDLNRPLTIQEMDANFSELSSSIAAVSSSVVENSYTETIVNISSSQILSGETITLLADLPDGQYYEGYGIIESTYGTADYIFGSYGIIDIIQGNNSIAKYRCTSTSGILYDGYKNYAKFELGIGKYNRVDNAITVIYDRSFVADGLSYNGLKMQWQSEVPTLGDGTLRIKIYHKTITFGA